MDEIGDRLLEAALALGAQQGWSGLQLHELAASQGLPLAEIQRRFAGKDAIAEALFDRAENALLAAAQREGWARLAPPERLSVSLLAWFAVLAPHRLLVREMLAYKLQPEHLHLQIGGLLRVSATVQWWREVALLRESGWRRELSEALLSAIYLGMVWRWLRDDSSGQAQSQAWLQRQLARLGSWLGPVHTNGSQRVATQKGRQRGAK